MIQTKCTITEGLAVTQGAKERLRAHLSTVALIRNVLGRQLREIPGNCPNVLPTL